MNIQHLVLIAFFALISVAVRAQSAPVVAGYVPVAQDGRIYYEIRGEGTPLLLLHGHTLDHRMWDDQVDVFAQHFKVITLDFRGYGRSSKQREDLHVAHLDDLISLMDTLKINKAHIVGLSMGGFIAGDMLGMHPERMLSCVMCSGALRSQHPSVSEPMDSAEIATKRAEITAIQAKGVEQWRSDWIESLICNGGSHSETMREALTRQIMDWDCFQITHIEPHLYYGREAMKNLVNTRPSVPTMYLSGETEHKKSMGLLKHLPVSRQIELPDCGHMSNMERPDIFNQAILNFLLTVE